MKRVAPTLTPPSSPPHKKRSPTPQPHSHDPLPYKLCLLQQWQLSPEASRYLRDTSRAQPVPLQDKTSPQLSLVPYQPRPILSSSSDTSSMVAESIESCDWEEESTYEPMEIEEPEWVNH